MLLSLLTSKEKLKFLDLCVYMIKVDEDTTAYERRLLDRMIAEMGKEITEDYSFERSANVEDTVDFFVNSSDAVKRIIFMGLMKISLADEFYNTSEHFFLEEIRVKFDISREMKKKLVQTVYDEKDLREGVKRLVFS